MTKYKSSQYLKSLNNRGLFLVMYVLHELTVGSTYQNHSETQAGKATATVTILVALPKDKDI